MNRMSIFVVVALGLLFLPLVTAGEEVREPEPGPPSRVSFHKEIQPILRRKCQGCHQPAKAGGKLVVTTYADLARGGRSQDDDPILVPGKPEDSLLWLEVFAKEGERPSMPKEGAPLTTAELDLLRRWVAEGAKDDTPDSIRVDPVTQDHPPVYERAPVVTSVDYSPDGSILAVSGYHEVLLHRADGGALIGRLVGMSERIESADFSPDGSLLAVTGGSPGRLGEVQIWDVEERKLRLSKTVTFDTLYGGSWSPDGKLIAFGCADNTVRAIDAESGEEVLYQGAHNDWVLDTAFSTDGSHLVSVSRDRSMKLIVVATQQFVDNITSITPGALKGGLMSVERHPSRDELAVGGADGAPKIYRMFREKKREIGDDFNLIRAFDPMPGRVFAVRFDKAGERLFAASSLGGAGEVRAYRVSDGALLWSVETPGGMYTVASSPDGATIAAGGFAGTVLLLDAATGDEKKQFVPVPLNL